MLIKLLMRNPFRFSFSPQKTFFHFLLSLPILLCVVLSPPALALRHNTTMSAQTNINSYTPYKSSNALHHNNTAAMPAPPSSQSLDVGPVNLNLTWSDPFGLILDARYARMLRTMSAYAIEAAVGLKENRVNITLGHAVSPKNRFKLTVERLAQKQSFEFYSGSTDQWVSQYAGGAQFQHLLGKGPINNFSLGGYYARALDKTLDTVVYKANKSEWYNYRHIAGAESKGFNTSVGIRPWKTGMMTLTGYYDWVHYHNKYANVSASNTSELGYGIALSQYLSTSVQASARYAHRAVYRTVEAGLQWSHNILHHTRAFALSLMGSHTKSDNVPHDNRVTLGFQYYFTPLSSTYHIPTFQVASLKTWVSEPAVRMEEVLVAADQKRKKITVGWANGFDYQFNYDNVDSDGYMTYSLVIDQPATSDSNEPLAYYIEYKGTKYGPYTAEEVEQGIKFEHLYPNTPQSFVVKVWDGYSYSLPKTTKDLSTKEGQASWNMGTPTFELDETNETASISFAPETCSVDDAHCHKEYHCDIKNDDKTIHFVSNYPGYSLTNKDDVKGFTIGNSYTLSCTATDQYDSDVPQEQTFTVQKSDNK